MGRTRESVANLYQTIPDEVLQFLNSEGLIETATKLLWEARDICNFGFLGLSAGNGYNWVQPTYKIGPYVVVSACLSNDLSRWG